MAQLRGRRETETPTPMFSPSVARVAAAEVKDWYFVDSWLAAQFPGRHPPPFERNADTLRALLALIAFNDSASEDARLLSRVDRDAIRDLPQYTETGGSPAPATLAVMRDSLLGIVEQELSKEGKVALNSMASMAISAKMAFPEPEQLGAAIFDTQSAVFEAERMISRAETLERHVHAEIAHTNAVLNTMQDDAYQILDGLGKRNLELQRTVKAMSAQAPEFERRIASLKSSVASSEFTVHDILREEQDYLAFVENRKELEKQISVFRGLPSDPDLARDELDAYRQELQGITSRRDAAFRGLVERETPVKRR